MAQKYKFQSALRRKTTTTKKRRWHISLTDDPRWSTHMPLHALVTRLPRRPIPAAALARDWVAWPRKRSPGGTLTFLAAASLCPRATTVACGTPARAARTIFERFTNFVATGGFYFQHLNSAIKLHKNDQPFTVFSLISLWTGSASVVVISLCHTGWTETWTQICIYLYKYFKRYW